MNLAIIGSGASGFPDDGTASFSTSQPGALGFGFTDFRKFDLLSLDLAEGSMTPSGPLTYHVFGYIAGGQGATVEADLTTDGINDGPGQLPDFQTFVFGDQFKNIYRVDITAAPFYIDNVRIGIPEPGIGALEGAQTVL